MITAAEVDLYPERGTPFVDVTAFEGYDYSAATFVMEIRDFKDKVGSPRVALANAAANAEGVSVSVATAGGIPTSDVQIRINETTIEGLPFSTPVRGEDRQLWYALDITGGGHVKTRRMKGRLIVQASANG